MPWVLVTLAMFVFVSFFYFSTILLGTRFCICICLSLCLYFPTILLGTADLSISSSSFLYLYLSHSCIFGQSSWGHQTFQFLFSIVVFVFVLVLYFRTILLGTPLLILPSDLSNAAADESIGLETTFYREAKKSLLTSFDSPPRLFHCISALRFH